MKKKILCLCAVIISLLISSWVGIFSFSLDNLSNRTNNRERICYALNQVGEYREMELSGFSDELISLGNSHITLTGIKTYVSNLRFNAESDNIPLSVKVCYTDGADSEFSEIIVVPTEVKNGDVYLKIDREVYSIRVFITEEAGVPLWTKEAEVNPTKFNINVVGLGLTLVFSLVILRSAISMLYDRVLLWKDLSAMKRYKYLLRDLVVKDIKTKYRRSVLGILWSVLNPLLMMLVLTAVFQNIIRVEVEGGFALFYLTGYIMFNFLSEASNFSLYTITSVAPLIKKVYIPKYIFPLQKCIFSFVNMMFSMIAFVVVFIAFAIMGKVTPSFTMLLFPLPTVLLFVFTLGLSLLLSTLVVFFRDVGHIWGILLTVWMYASPIIYPISLVPSWLANLIKLNPLYYYIDCFRSVMIYGRVPNIGDIAICFFYAVAMLMLGLVVFRKNQDKFVLYI